MTRPPAEVPTLTEVVAVDAPAPQAAGAQVLPWPQPDEADAALVQKVLHEVQRQAARMFEYRMREALAPVLAEAAEQLVAQARDALATTLHDVVQRAVAQALARERRR